MQAKCWDIRLTLVPFKKLPMASKVERINPKVLLCSSWSIPSFRSRSGSATSCHEKRNKKVKAAVGYSCFKFLILWFRLITEKSSELVSCRVQTGHVCWLSSMFQLINHMQGQKKKNPKT